MQSRLIKVNNTNSNSKIGKERFYYGWVVLAACLVIMIAGYGIRYSFGVFFKSLEQEFELTRAITSGIFSVYMILGSLFAIFAGLAIDRYGARIVFVLMGIFTCLSLSLTSLANVPWHLFISFSLLLAIGNGPTWTISMALATRWFTDRRGLALGIVGSGVGIGSVLMSPIAAYLISGYGWRTSYLVMALIPFLLFIPSSLLLKKSPSEEATSVKDKKPDTVNLNSPEGQNNEPKEFTLLQAAKTRSMWLLISIWFLYSFCLLMTMTHVVPHAIDLGITSMQSALMLSIMGGVNIPGRIVMGIVTDRFGWKRAAIICALLMAAAMLWLAQSSSLWMLYLFAVVFGFSYGGLAPPTTAIVGDIFGLRHIGVILGLLGISWGVGSAIGPALAGYIYDTTGSYYLAFLLGMAAMLIIIVSVLSVRTATRPSDIKR